jgi:hypothetical protein
VPRYRYQSFKIALLIALSFICGKKELHLSISIFVCLHDEKKSISLTQQTAFSASNYLEAQRDSFFSPPLSMNQNPYGAEKQLIQIARPSNFDSAVSLNPNALPTVYLSRIPTPIR